MNSVQRMIFGSYSDLYQDDITFCGHMCSQVDCFRNECNCKHPEYPHSISDFYGTAYCKFDQYGEEKSTS